MTEKKNVHILEQRIDFESITYLFSTLDYSICMRFHSHIFSILSGTPFISLCISPKVEKICQELGEEYNQFIYKAPREASWSFPTYFDTESIVHSFSNLYNNPPTLLIRSLREKWTQNIKLFPNALRAILTKKENFSPKRRKVGPRPLSLKQEEEKKLSAARMIVKLVLSGTFLEDRPSNIENFAKEFASGHLNLALLYNIAMESMTMLDKGVKRKETIGHIATRIICYAITGQSYPIYFYGLNEQIWNKVSRKRHVWTQRQGIQCKRIMGLDIKGLEHF
jgi:hypothetical protein